MSETLTVRFYDPSGHVLASYPIRVRESIGSARNKQGWRRLPGERIPVFIADRDVVVHRVTVSAPQKLLALIPSRSEIPLHTTPVFMSKNNTLTIKLLSPFLVEIR